MKSMEFTDKVKNEVNSHIQKYKSLNQANMIRETKQACGSQMFKFN